MNILTHPAYLLLGSNNVVLPQLIEWLQQILCKKNGCGTCSTCLSIRDKQHHAMLWLTPEKKYTLDAIEPIFKQISFQLEESEHFYFIIEQADQLTPACQNALLKSVEEPPHGYHFIFCTSSKESLLTTLTSRCMMTALGTEDSTTHLESLKDCILQGQDPQQFLELLSTLEINEQQCEQLLELLLASLLQKQLTIKKGTQEFERLNRLNTIVHNAFEQLPMPGSSKIFLKNLFLQMLP